MILNWHPIIAQYIDPGTGSYIYQILIAGFTALLFFFSFRIKGIFSKFFGSAKKNDKPE
jgi:hypothetical protein